MAGEEKQERVILVDADDREIGSEEKLQAHRLGLLHRAFSVFIVDGKGRVLLQRRAARKYHSGGLWSNTTCGHPRPGETTPAAASRRLREEMGIDCALTPAFAFTYSLPITAELSEHELDHVFIGTWQGFPTPDPAEVSDWAWRDVGAIELSVSEHPELFSAWLPIAWPKVKQQLAAVAGR